MDFKIISADSKIIKEIRLKILINLRVKIEENLKRNHTLI